MRKATFHTNRVKPNKKISVSIIESVSVSDSVSIKVVRVGKGEDQSGQDPKPITPTGEAEKNLYSWSRPTNKKSDSGEISKEIVRLFVPYPNKNLNEICEHYLSNLNALVDECQQRFSNLN